MKKFIEVLTENGKRLINVNAISHVQDPKGGHAQIMLITPNGRGFINVQGSYEEVKALIEAAL